MQATINESKSEGSVHIIETNSEGVYVIVY